MTDTSNGRSGKRPAERGASGVREVENATFPSISGVTEEQWKRISFEASVLDRLRAGPRTRKAAALAGTILGWSPAKVYRKLKRYRDAGHAMGLAKTGCGRSWRSRLTIEQDEIIEKALQTFLRKHRGKPVAEFVKMALAALKEARVLPPSPRSVRRRFERLPERVRYAHWHGASAAADKYDLKKGSTPPTHFPLERIQIDHTAADIWLLSEDHSLSLGRPTVTMVIDEFSRIVLGIHVTFGHPSVEELAEAMAIACLPKDGWLRAKGIEGVDWPWFGLPAGIYVDRGVDFTSTSFHRGCQKWRIDLSHRAQPHDGGIIERLIGTAMGQTRILPGSTRFSKAKRKEDRVDPAKTARLTLNEYLAELVHYFVGEYPHRIHPELGMTPAEKWNLGVHQYGDPARVPDPNAFYLDFLKCVRRKLEKYGVMISYLEYRDSRLQSLLNHAKSMQVLVKRDPADVSRAFLEDPRGGGYIELSNELTRGTMIGVAEWEKARKELKVKLIGQQVTARGILGIVQQARKTSARKLTAAQAESKLNRGKRRNEERRRERQERSARRIPRRAPTPSAPAPRPMIDLSKIPFFKNSGDE